MKNMILATNTSKREVWIHESDVHRFKMIRLLNEAVYKMETARGILESNKRGTKLIDRRINSVKNQISRIMAEIKPQIVKDK